MDVCTNHIPTRETLEASNPRDHVCSPGFDPEGRAFWGPLTAPVLPRANHDVILAVDLESTTSSRRYPIDGTWLRSQLP